MFTINADKTNTSAAAPNMLMIMNRKKALISREIRIFMIFSFVVFAVKFFPGAFSFNQQSKLFEKYYSDSLPVHIIDLFIVIYLVRLAIVTISWFVRGRSDKHGAS